MEAHGTGTPVGDPIEAIALRNVLGKNCTPGEYCIIGSVKTNIGNLEAASGVAGLIKLALALKHGQIPPSLHLSDTKSQNSFEELRLRVLTALEPWPNCNGPCIAGINSFGFGGTNAHLVLAEAPLLPISQSEIPTHQSLLLPLSDRSEEALKALAGAYKHFLTNEDSSLSDICYAASLHRGHHNYRLSVVGNSQQELAEHLEAFLAGETRLGMSSGRVLSDSSPKLAFVFSGMGQQWWAMGRTLLEEESAIGTSQKNRCKLVSDKRTSEPYWDCPFIPCWEAVWSQPNRFGMGQLTSSALVMYATTSSKEASSIRGLLMWKWLWLQPKKFSVRGLMFWKMLSFCRRCYWLTNQSPFS